MPRKDTNYCIYKNDLMAWKINYITTEQKKEPKDFSFIQSSSFYFVSFWS